MDAQHNAAVIPEWVGTNKAENDILDQRRVFLDGLLAPEKDARSFGSFFTNMELIWDKTPTAIKAEDFETIRRTFDQGKAYDLCCKYIDADEHTMGAGSRSGKTNADDNGAKVDAYGNNDCDSAHLLSHAQVCYKGFVFLGEAAVGRKVHVPPATRSGRRPAKQAKLGARINSDARKRLMILNGIHGKGNTSLKSHQYNKMYLKDQGKLYDTESPSILVIPLLSLDQVMDWAKEGNQKPYNILTLTFGPRARGASTILSYAPQECNQQEIEQARDLLETFVKGVAGSLVENDVLESFTKTELNTRSNVSLIRWMELVKRIKEKTQATIETPSHRAPSPNFHVAKARLSRGNSLPDPWLLMLKAAINYSASNNTKLMPACPPNTDDDDGPPNTDQGREDCKDHIDHAAELAFSKQRGGITVEMFDCEK
jgi:hypothetical protein